LRYRGGVAAAVRLSFVSAADLLARFLHRLCGSKYSGSVSAQQFWNQQRNDKQLPSASMTAVQQQRQLFIARRSSDLMMHDQRLSSSSMRTTSNLPTCIHLGNISATRHRWLSSSPTFSNMRLSINSATCSQRANKRLGNSSSNIVADSITTSTNAANTICAASSSNTTVYMHQREFQQLGQLQTSASTPATSMINDGAVSDSTIAAICNFR
jgi:hypothetical protein